jgi:serine/threonine-protein kinase
MANTLCPTCRAENSETANFCSNCATTLRGPDGGAVTLPLPESATQTYESRAWDLPTGTLFGGRYQIIESLGRGGMGRVYRALDTKAHEEVAIKLIRPDIAEDKDSRALRQRDQLAHKFSHRNIGKMSPRRGPGPHYIIMEYVPGEDLKLHPALPAARYRHDRGHRQAGLQQPQRPTTRASSTATSSPATS